MAKNKIVASQKDSNRNFKVTDPEIPFMKRYPAFSFKYYHDSHQKFSAKSIKSIDEFIEWLLGLKKLSASTWEALLRAKQAHCHEVRWEQTTQKNGFQGVPGIPKEYNNFSPIQFKAFQECRIVGFINSENVFEVIWFDRRHEIYRKGK